MPSDRARMAACDVALPSAVTTAWTAPGSSRAAWPSEVGGHHDTDSDATALGVWPRRWLSTCWPTARTSAARALRYGSSRAVKRAAKRVDRPAMPARPTHLLRDDGKCGAGEIFVVEEQQMGVEDLRSCSPALLATWSRVVWARHEPPRSPPEAAPVLRPARRFGIDEKDGWLRERGLWSDADAGWRGGGAPPVAVERDGGPATDSSKFRRTRAATAVRASVLGGRSGHLDRLPRLNAERRQR